MPSVLDRITALATGGDADRLAKRREIKQRLAVLEAAASRERAIVAQLGTLGQREQKAIGKHQGICGPLQERLTAIDEEISNAILDGREVDEAVALERGKLLEGIAGENAKLEAEVDSLKKLRKQFTLQRQAVAVQVAELSHVRGQLSGHGVADPRLLVERAICQHAVEWADKRRIAAKRELEICQENLRVQQHAREKQRYVNSHGIVVVDPQPSEHELRLEREVEEWLAEVDASEAAWREADEQRADVRRRILEE